MKINPRYDLGELARRIQGDRRSLAPVSFDGFGVENVQSILESGVEFHPEVPEADKRRLVWKAITQSAGTETITLAVLKAALEEQELTYLHEPVRRYVVATSVTLDASLAPRVVSVDGSRILFSRRLPVSYSFGEIVAERREHTKISDPHRLVSVRIPVRARTPAAAFELALSRLDFWRGLWNYQINRRTALRRSSAYSKAINELLLGPVHTLHSPRGRIAADVFWFEPYSQQSSILADVRFEVPHLSAGTRLLRQRIWSCAYGEDLRALVVRYCRALDVPEYPLAYNNLWAVFEHLAGAVGDYRRLIERVLFLYDPAETAYVRLLLEHLRDVRNGMVHESQTRSEMETFLYQLKSFVEDLFGFHLSAPNPFGSLATATAFLDLPLDAALLKERLTLLRRAHKFRRPRSTS